MLVSNTSVLNEIGLSTHVDPQNLLQDRSQPSIRLRYLLTKISRIQNYFNTHYQKNLVIYQVISKFNI